MMLQVCVVLSDSVSDSNVVSLDLLMCLVTHTLHLSHNSPVATLL